MPNQERATLSERFLTRRPLPQALDGERGRAPVLLIVDEIDCSDEPFEAYLREVLADFQVTTPSPAPSRLPIRRSLLITSDPTREIHDAVIGGAAAITGSTNPDAAREFVIVRRAMRRYTRMLLHFVHANGTVATASTRLLLARASPTSKLEAP